MDGNRLSLPILGIDGSIVISFLFKSSFSHLKVSASASIRSPAYIPAKIIGRKSSAALASSLSSSSTVKYLNRFKGSSIFLTNLTGLSPSYYDSETFKETETGTGKRELIDTCKNKRYVRRGSHGRFREGDDVRRSLSRDVRKKAETKVKPGYGGRGDR